MLFKIKYFLILLLTLFASACTQKMSNPCVSQDIIEYEFIPKEQIVMFGETHGNVESSKHFMYLACQQLKLDKNLVVALEVESDLKPKLDTYLISNGIEKDKRELINHHFWQKEIQDGRSSIAMFNMLELLRKIKYFYPNALNVVLIDGKLERFKEIYTLHDRNGIMANNLELISDEYPNSLIYTLIGNFHNQKNVFENLKHLTPTAKRIGKPYHSVLLQHSGGDSWNCITTCGVTNNQELSKDNIKGQMQWYKNNGIYDDVITIGRTTHSLPAKTLYTE